MYVCILLCKYVHLYICMLLFAMTVNQYMGALLAHVTVTLNTYNINTVLPIVNFMTSGGRPAVN